MHITTHPLSAESPGCRHAPEGHLLSKEGCRSTPIRAMHRKFVGQAVPPFKPANYRAEKSPPDQKSQASEPICRPSRRTSRETAGRSEESSRRAGLPPAIRHAELPIKSAEPNCRQSRQAKPPTRRQSPEPDLTSHIRGRPQPLVREWPVA